METFERIVALAIFATVFGSWFMFAFHNLEMLANRKKPGSLVIFFDLAWWLPSHASVYFDEKGLYHYRKAVKWGLRFLGALVFMVLFFAVLGLLRG